MKRGVLLKSGAGVVVVALGGFVGWILTLPPAPASTGAPATDSRETQAMLDALKAPKRPRPVVAVVGINDATETNDYLMPAGILRRADVADVTLVATHAGPCRCTPPSPFNRTRPSRSSTCATRMARTT